MSSGVGEGRGGHAAWCSLDCLSEKNNILRGAQRTTIDSSTKDPVENGQMTKLRMLSK